MKINKEWHLKNKMPKIEIKKPEEKPKEISKKVEKGFPLGDTFAQYEVFPPIVSQMMKVGEETGKIDETLLKLSNYFQSEVEVLVKGLTTAIEPIIMVVLGVGVVAVGIGCRQRHRVGTGRGIGVAWVLHG